MAATSLNHLLEGIQPSPQLPRITMRKTYHQAGQCCQLAEFSAAKVRNPYMFGSFFCALADMIRVIKKKLENTH